MWLIQQSFLSNNNEGRNSFLCIINDEVLVNLSFHTKIQYVVIKSLINQFLPSSTTIYYFASPEIISTMFSLNMFTFFHNFVKG